MKGANRRIRVRALVRAEPGSTFVPRDAAEGRTETKTQRTSDTLSDTPSVTSVHRPPPPCPAAAKRLRLVRVRQLEDVVWWSRNSGAACEASAWAPVCPRERSRRERRSCRRSERRPRRSSFERRGYESTRRRRRRRRRRRAVPRSSSDPVPPTDPSRPTEVAVAGGAAPSASTASTATPGRGSEEPRRPGTSRSGARAPRPATSPHRQRRHAQSPSAEAVRNIACVRAVRARVRARPGAAVRTTAGAEAHRTRACLAIYRTGVCAGAGWMAVAIARRRGCVAAPTPFEIRWDLDSRAKPRRGSRAGGRRG